MWGPIQTDPRRYKATAMLTRSQKSTSQEKEKRGGIICRVEHCSLMEPIERQWRHIDIGRSHFYHPNSLYIDFYCLYCILTVFSFHYFVLSVCNPPVAPTIPPSISVCWSSEGVGVFSILLKGGHPKVKLVWAAGGATLSPLVSSETEEIGDDGQRELKSVCALERSTGPPSQPEKPQQRRKKGHAISMFRNIAHQIYFLKSALCSTILSLSIDCHHSRNKSCCHRPRC